MSETVKITVECGNSDCRFDQPVEIELRRWGSVVEWPELRCLLCGRAVFRAELPEDLVPPGDTT